MCVLSYYCISWFRIEICNTEWISYHFIILVNQKQMLTKGIPVFSTVQLISSPEAHFVARKFYSDSCISYFCLVCFLMLIFSDSCLQCILEFEWIDSLLWRERKNVCRGQRGGELEGFVAFRFCHSNLISNQRLYLLSWHHLSSWWG